MKCKQVRALPRLAMVVAVAAAVAGQSVRSAVAAYIDDVLATPNLVATWRLGETGGATAVEEVGTNTNANDGVYTNFSAGDYNQQSLLPYDNNPAARFNGSNSYVNAGNDASLNGAWSGITMFAWVNPVSTSGASLVTGKWAGAPTNDHYGLFIVDGKLMGAIGNGINGISGTAGTATIPTNQPTFLAFTWQSGSGTYQLYVNGAIDPIAVPGTAVTSMNAASTKDFFIGAQSPGVRHFNGIIDEVALFDRALSASEIAAFYLSSQTAPPPPVPEPSTALLLVTGLALVVRCRRAASARLK